MFLSASGLRTHIWNNNLRSILLLAGFPLLLIAIGFAFAVLWGGQAVTAQQGWRGTRPSVGTEHSVADALGAVLANGPMIALVSLAITAVWFIIAWFFHTAIIQASTGARSVTRAKEPELYNLLENLCISRGMTMPRLAVIETGALNAYASGVRESQYTVTVTRGLMQTLDRAELEAVLAHELSHIRHGDVRLLVIAVIFVGIISFAGELMFRSLFMRSVRRSGSNRQGRNGAALVFIALAIVAVAYGLAILIRFSLSRRREYMADAGAVELTRNPDAMISALMKISGRSEVDKAPDEVREMFIDNPRTGFMGFFATHPTIDQRIDALVDYADGQRPAAPSTTSVPEV